MRRQRRRVGRDTDMGCSTRLGTEAEAVGRGRGLALGDRRAHRDAQAVLARTQDGHAARGDHRRRRSPGRACVALGRHARPVDAALAPLALDGRGARPGSRAVVAAGRQERSRNQDPTRHLTKGRTARTQQANPRARPRVLVEGDLLAPDVDAFGDPPRGRTAGGRRRRRGAPDSGLSPQRPAAAGRSARGRRGRCTRPGRRESHRRSSRVGRAGVMPELVSQATLEAGE